MSLIITRANPSNWVAGNLLTAVQVNTLDTNAITVAEYVESQRIDVKLYGAAGDGSTDDSSAIQDAVDAAVTAEVPVWFPPGVYLCNNISWGTCSLIGEVHRSAIHCNSTLNPIFVSTVSSGVDATNYPARTVSGLEFSFDSTSSSGRLISLSGDTRVLFDSCFLDGTGSSATGVGLLDLGDTSDTTRVVLRDSGFLVAGAGDQAIGLAGGTTHVMMTDCRVRVTSTSRSETPPIIDGTVIKVSNCYFDLSSAQAASTYIKVFGSASAEDTSVSTSTVTAAASGTVWLFSHGIATGAVTESANYFPSNARLQALEPGYMRMDSRHRVLNITQSGGGALTLDARNYDMFNIDIDDTDAFTVHADSCPVGTEFDVMFTRSASPSGTISWGSGFGSFGTVNDGAAMPAVVLPGYVATGRFRRANGSDGTPRWYLIGSGVLYA